MSALVLFSPAKMPDTTAHKNELMSGEFTLEPKQRLLPVAILNGIVREQNKGLLPAEKKTRIDATQYLIGSYPINKIEDPNMFVQSLNMMLEKFDYPADILRIGMMDLINENKWMPAVAEIKSCMDRLKFARSAVKSRAENQLKEHERRKQESPAPAISKAQRERNQKTFEEMTKGK